MHSGLKTEFNMKIFRFFLFNYKIMQNTQKAMILIGVLVHYYNKTQLRYISGDFLVLTWQNVVLKYSSIILQFWKEQKVIDDYYDDGEWSNYASGFVLWPKTYAQASMCELVRYNSVKSMIGFSTLLWLIDELFRIIGG